MCLTDRYVSASGSVGGARPCQGRGRGFESRLALYRKKRYTIWCVSFFCRAICAPRGEEIYASHTARARKVLVLRSTPVGAKLTSRALKSDMRTSRRRNLCFAYRSGAKGSRSPFHFSFSFHFGVAFLRQIRYNNRKKCVKKG